MRQKNDRGALSVPGLEALEEQDARRANGGFGWGWVPGAGDIARSLQIGLGIGVGLSAAVGCVAQPELCPIIAAGAIQTELSIWGPPS